MRRRRVYGPVPSRRFGLSLGVDLVPYKTCCLDCTYCQLGRTTKLTTDREDFFSPGEALADLQEALASGPRPDVITLAGSGEPTLYRPLGRLIEGIRDLSDIPILLLSNGALLFEDEVARDALLADILAPSLDAGEEETFKRINRPDDSIDFEVMLEGLRAVCSRRLATVRLEVMLVKDVNDSDESVRAIARQLESIDADSVDINTPVRPVSDRSILPCSANTLETARAAFGPKARIVAAYTGPEIPPEQTGGGTRELLELLARRPCTVEDIHASLGIHRAEILKLLSEALRDGIVEERAGEGKSFFFRR